MQDMNARTMTTEQRNPNSEAIDTLTALQLVDLIRSEDAKVVAAIEDQREQIAKAIDAITNQFRVGGRLFYVGAGTSGRLGVLDASECPPTFNTAPEIVVGLIAGGPDALTRAIAGAEDDWNLAASDLQLHAFHSNDILVGIATSGRTPYVLGAIDFAKQAGAATVGLACNAGSPLSERVDIMITPVVGPEVISGSTRMKAGTATKMVLNMLTTGAMVQLGKTFGNLMVDLRTSNSKLKDRSVRIVADVTGSTAEQAGGLLEKCDGEVKTAILVALAQTDPENARALLAAAQGRLRDAIRLAKPE